MQHEKKNKQTRKIIIIILVILIALVAIAVVAINVYYNKDDNDTEEPNENLGILNGVYIYNEAVKYEFDGKGKGAMYDNDTKYEYTYTINYNELKIDFKNERMFDSTYSFRLEDDTLTLLGGEGTTGGEYILKKENE